MRLHREPSANLGQTRECTYPSVGQQIKLIRNCLPECGRNISQGLSKRPKIEFQSYSEWSEAICWIQSSGPVFSEPTTELFPALHLSLYLSGSLWRWFVWQFAIMLNGQIKLERSTLFGMFGGGWLWIVWKWKLMLEFLQNLKKTQKIHLRMTFLRFQFSQKS